MWQLGIDEQYVREAFSALCDLDLMELTKVPNYEFKFLAWPGKVQVHDVDYTFVMNEGKPGDLYVDEYRETATERNGFPSHWHEVFRIGKHIENPRFVAYLRILYGEGKHVQDTKSKSVGVRASGKEYESHEALGSIRARPVTAFIQARGTEIH